MDRSAGIETTLPNSRQLGDGGVPGVGLARADVDAGAGLQQAAGDHQADAAGAAGDHGDLAGQVEQVHGAPPSSGSRLRCRPPYRHTIQRAPDAPAGARAGRCASL